MYVQIWDNRITEESQQYLALLREIIISGRLHRTDQSDVFQYAYTVLQIYYNRLFFFKREKQVFVLLYSVISYPCFRYTRAVCKVRRLVAVRCCYAEGGGDSYAKL
jgi:hypothetical protein